VRAEGLWLGLAILVAGGAMTAWLAMRSTSSTALRQRALPGFDIDLPVGTSKIEALKYEEGRVQINNVAGGGSSLQVTWEPGGLFTDEDVTRTNKMIGGALKAEVRDLSISSPISIPGRAPTRSWAVRFGGLTSWATQVVCGTRRVTLMTMGRTESPERLHRRMAASFRCRPDAAQEPIPGDVPVVLDVGPGWYRLAGVDGDVEITDGRFVLLVRPITGGLRPDKVRETFAAGMPNFEYGEPVGDDWPFVDQLSGQTMNGWLTLNGCPDGGRLLVMALTTAEGGADGRAKARALLPRARCRKRGEPPQRWPEARK
jgi:hypothetical protein